MDYIMIIIIIILAIGLGIVIYSIFMKDNELENRFSTLEADNAMDEFNNLSKDVFTEFDEKYKELLFLYEMLDSKKNDSTKEVKEAVKKAEEKISIMVNPKLKEILELKNKGMSISNIAKTLNMGQGEVQLILNLSRNR